MNLQNKLNIGDKIYKWTIIDNAIPDKMGRRHWTCKCECGIQKRIEDQALKRGKTRSCGISKCNYQFLRLN